MASHEAGAADGSGWHEEISEEGIHGDVLAALQVGYNPYPSL